MISPAHIGVYCMALAIILLFFIHMKIERSRGHWSLFDPLNVFFGGAAVCYVFQPVAYLEQLEYAYTPAVLLTTMAAILWGLIWLVIGYHTPWAAKVSRKLPNMPAQLNPQHLSGLGWTIVGLGFLGYAILISTAESFDAWLSVGRTGTRWESVSGYFEIIEHFLPAGIAILLFRVELIKTSSAMRTFVWSLAILQWMWLVYLGSRSRTIVFLVTMACAYFLPRRKNPRLIPTVIAGALLFLLVNFQGHYRSQFTNLSFHLDNMNFDEVMKSILPRSLGGTMGNGGGRSLGDLEINCVAAVIDTVPSQTPYNHGYTLLELVTHGIPHGLWPNKIYPLYEAQTPVMQLRNLSSHWYVTPTTRFLTGPAFTYIGYWYHAGGWIALVLAGLFTGALFRGIRGYLDRDPGNQGNLILYVLLLPIGFYEAASTPFYWVFFLMPIILPIVALMYFGRRSSAEESSIGMPTLAAHNALWT